MPETNEALSAPNRMALIVQMAPKGKRCVDVGCDHGHVSAALSAVASEKEPHRLPRRTDVPRVVADGLLGHKNVELAILTGMGPKLILKILDAGPSPEEAIVHSPQHTHVLREGLAERGWRVHREGLAPENGRYAEVLHIRRGAPKGDGYLLAFGPSFMEHPWGWTHANRLREDWSRLQSDAPSGTNAHRKASGWIKWLDSQLPKLKLRSESC
jgi:tRNA A22 N-methylase